MVARYIRGNPNGSQRDIAAITNEAGNVVGIMPHPEHAVEALTGPSLDGLGFFTSVLRALAGSSAGGDRFAGARGAGGQGTGDRGAGGQGAGGQVAGGQHR